MVVKDIDANDGDEARYVGAVLTRIPKALSGRRLRSKVGVGAARVGVVTTVRVHATVATGWDWFDSRLVGVRRGRFRGKGSEVSSEVCGRFCWPLVQCTKRRPLCGELRRDPESRRVS